MDLSLLVVYAALGVAFMLTLLLAVVLGKRGHRACLRQRTLEVALTPAAALDRCMAGLVRTSGGVHVPQVELGDDRFEATVGVTLWSIGERVRVTAEAVAPGRTRVHVESWSRLATTLADWGKNAANVARIAAALEEVEAPAEVAVAARPGLTRCPYCHEDAEPTEAVACVACLARHHAGCWDEQGACSACSGVERFAGIERSAEAPPARQPRPVRGKD